LAPRPLSSSIDNAGHIRHKEAPASDITFQHQLINPIMKTIILFLLCCLPASLSGHIVKGAEYRSKDFYTYGRFEARIRSANRDGMLTSFFTYNDSFPATPWNEIDIEILGRYQDDVQFNPISPGQTNHVSHYQTSFNPALDYHTYAFEWTPAYVAWFVDGSEVHRQTGPDIEALNRSQKIMMNIWNPEYTTWVGAWDARILPVFTYYDWVSYSSYTPGSGTSGTGNNFSLQWKDEFDSWDTLRWEKGAHTFSGNGCDFIPENAVFIDGKLVLCLTSDVATGYTDLTKPVALNGRAEANGVRIRFSEEIDRSTAEIKTNYIVSGMTVNSALLQPDSQSVFVTFTNYDTTAINNIIIMTEKDRWTPPNASGASNLILAKAHPLSLPLHINCGGPAYGNSLADQEWGSTVEYGFMDGSVRNDSSVFSGTTDQTVYQSERQGLARYRIRLPNGPYGVLLQMAESQDSVAGQRVFSVFVQGQLIAKDLDLFALVGKHAAYEHSTSALVANGILEFAFAQGKGLATISGIVVYPLGDAVEEGTIDVPEEFSIGQNYPNPFNPSTMVSYQLPVASNVRLAVYDVLGREVRTLVNEAKKAGTYSATWNAAGRASGVYFARLTAGGFTRAVKMVLMR
jgi:hypothetical protein